MPSFDEVSEDLNVLADVAAAPTTDELMEQHRRLRAVLRDCKTWLTGPAWLRQEIEDVLAATEVP